MGDSVRFALVGLGDIGYRAHLPALLDNQRVRVVALVDPDEMSRERAREMANAHGHGDAVCVSGMDAMPDVDAVVLATPPWVTSKLIPHALGDRRYVLAEKPLATSVAGAEELSILGEDALARLQVGLTYRHDPALARLRECIDAGSLGERLLIRAHIYDEPRGDPNSEYGRRILENLAHGPPVMHEGSHVFDWLSYLLHGTSPRIVDAWQFATEPHLGSANLSGGRLVYPPQMEAVVEFGWWTDRLPKCELSVIGDSGMAVLDGMTFRLSVHTADGDQVWEFERDRAERSFAAQLSAFLDLIDGRVSAMPGFAEGMASLRISETMAQRAMEEPIR